MSTNTTYYNLEKPDVGGALGQWGTKLNADLDAIDLQMKTNANAAAAASAAAAAASANSLPLAGGTMTGPIRLKALRYDQVSYGAGNPVMDLAVSTVHNVAMTGGITITLSNKPSAWWTVEIWLNNPSNYAMLFADTIHWDSRKSGTAEAPNNTGAAGGPGFVYHIRLWCDGTTIFGTWERYA